MDKEFYAIEIPDLNPLLSNEIDRENLEVHLLCMATQSYGPVKDAVERAYTNRERVTIARYTWDGTLDKYGLPAEGSYEFADEFTGLLTEFEVSQLCGWRGNGVKVELALSPDFTEVSA